jgi:ABC transporter DrrB family efflux protein
VFLALTGHPAVAPAAPEDDGPADEPDTAPDLDHGRRRAVSPAPAGPPTNGPATDRPPTGARRLVGDTVATSGRELLRMARSPQLLAYMLMQPVLFVGGMAAVFGGAIALAATGQPGGRYIDYLLPGSVVMAMVLAGSATSLAVAEDRQRGFTERLRTLPMARSAPLAGRSFADLLRNVVGVAAMVGTALLFGFRAPAGWPPVLAGLALALLFGYATFWVYALTGLAAKDPESANAMSFMPTLLLVFASSAFVPVETMPTWLQAIARYQPVTIAIDAVRSTMAGQVPAQGWWPVLAWTVGLLAVFAPLAVRRYDRALT